MAPVPRPGRSGIVRPTLSETELWQFSIRAARFGCVGEKERDRLDTTCKDSEKVYHPLKSFN